MRVRRDKRQQLLDAGEEPYPVVVDRTHTLKQIVDTYDAEALGADVQTGDIVSVTGRVIFVRNTGKLCFVAPARGRRHRAAGHALARPASARSGSPRSSRSSTSATTWRSPARSSRAGAASCPSGHVVADRGQDRAPAAQRAQPAVGRGAQPHALRRPDRAARGARQRPRQGQGPAVAARDARRARVTSRSTPRSCSTPTAAPRRARSRRTPTRSTRTCCCASRSSCTSSARSSAASTGSTRSARRSATRASTTPTTPSS